MSIPGTLWFKLSSKRARRHRRAPPKDFPSSQQGTLYRGFSEKQYPVYIMPV